MARFHIKVVDRFQRVLGENDVNERDLASACRSAAIAAALFCFGNGGYPGGHIVIEDERGQPVASVSLESKSPTPPSL